MSGLLAARLLAQVRLSAGLGRRYKALVMEAPYFSFATARPDAIAASLNALFDA